MAYELENSLALFTSETISNKIAEDYMNEMIETEVSVNQQEELNFQILKQTIREQNIDISTVCGSGLACEFVFQCMQRNICERSQRNKHPDSWDDDNDWPNDGIYSDSNTLKPPWMVKN